MCRIFSGISTKTGENYFIPEYTDSHEVIAKAHNLRDTEEAYYSGTLVRWEFTPPEDLTKLEECAAWGLRVDEKKTPEWFDPEMIREFAWRRVSQMFVREMRGTILGGCWIFLSGGGCKELLAGRIVIVREGCNLSEANLSGANLSGANLSEANLSGAHLSRANLSWAYLSEANLSGAHLSRANLSGAHLSRANLSWANLSWANLSGAYLSWANLSGANLSWVDLSRANLSGANLSGANLSGVNLSGANLSGANLSRANLSWANLSGAFDYNLPPEWEIKNGICQRIA